MEDNKINRLERTCHNLGIHNGDLIGDNNRLKNQLRIIVNEKNILKGEAHNAKKAMTQVIRILAGDASDQAKTEVITDLLLPQVLKKRNELSNIIKDVKAEFINFMD